MPSTDRAAPRRALALVRQHVTLEVVTVIVLVITVLAGPRLILGPSVIVETVVQQDFVQSVVASGRVETPHRADVGVQITGTVRRVPVVDGQSVTAGTVLIELEASELQAALGQAERSVQSAAAKVRQLREVQSPAASQTQRQAQLSYDAARDALARSQALLAGGAIGEAALDEARRAEQKAAAQLQIARQEAASARPTGSDAAAASAALAQAQAGAELARARLAYATVRAPKAGTLIARDVEPGDGVQPGKVLMVLSPGGETQLVVQIDERNLRLLSLGLQALASADAYPAQRFPAAVVYINPGVDAQRGAVEVKLRVPSPPAYLKQDMTVSVDIEIARRAKAVLLPADAVHDIATTSPWVLRIDGRRARRQPVTLGIRSGGWCEVLGGVSPGALVVPVAAVGVTDGQRVRAAAVVAP